jgi:ABC-type transport system substrate-binding protein
VLYCLRQGGGVRAARIIAHDLAAIGIDVRVRCMPGDQFWPRILLHADEPWDMAVVGGWGYNDPTDFLGSLGHDTASNVSHFHDARYTRMLRAASRLSGTPRAIAYARIDDELVRDAAPWIAYANESAHDFFSARMGCQVFQPVNGMDLAALCVRSRG